MSEQQDNAEPSGASAGSQPVALAVYDADGAFCSAFEHPRGGMVIRFRDRTYVPLYRQPHPALTDEEREAIEAAVRIIDAYDEDMDGFPSGAAATLRKMLERLG